MPVLRYLFFGFFCLFMGLYGQDCQNVDLKTLQAAPGWTSASWEVDPNGQLVAIVIDGKALNEPLKIPKDIGCFIYLQRIEIKNAQLSSVPSSLGKLYKLYELNLSGNALTQLPNTFYQLTSLKSVNLSHNAFIEIPEVLTTLEIQELLLADNKIQSLPASIVDIRSLTILDLSDNPFLGFPAPLFIQLPSLQEVNWTGNVPIPATLLEFLRKRKPKLYIQH